MHLLVMTSMIAISIFLFRNLLHLQYDFEPHARRCRSSIMMNITS